MSRADFVVSPELSSKLAPGHLGSADTLIRSRKQVEVKPQSSETIELYPSPTSRTEFVLNAHSGWMDNSKSHFECEVAVYSKDNATRIKNMSLCTGGLHSMIRNVTIVDGSGTEISNSPEYAKLFGIMSNYTQSPEHVEKSGMFSGDSVQPYFVDDLTYSQGDDDTGYFLSRTNVDAATVTVVNGVIGDMDLADEDPERDAFALVGDFVKIHCVQDDGTEGGTFVAEITAVGATSITTSTNALGTQAYSAGQVRSIEILNGAALQKSTRFYVATRATTNDISDSATSVADGQWVKLQIQIMNPFLQMDEYVPLLFIPNMRIIIEWNPAWMCVMHGYPSKSTDLKTPVVRIRNPRYVMSVVEPVEQVIADWHARYMSDQGLIYHIVDYYNSRKYLETSANPNWVVPCTFVSARAAIAAQYPPACFTKSDSVVQVSTTGVADSFSLDKTGTFYVAKVYEYEFVVGSDRYPVDGRVQCDKLGGENLLHNLKTLGVADSKDLKLRFSPVELRGIHPTNNDLKYGVTAGGITYNDNQESMKTIFTADLTKEGELSGVSLRNQDLQPMFYRSSAAQWTNPTLYNRPLYCLVWIPHDRVIRVSKADGGVRIFD